MIRDLEKILLFCGIFLLIAKTALAGVLFWEELKNPQVEISPAYGGAQAEEVINLTNQYRLDHDLSQLLPNPRLTQAAINKAKDILSRNYFSHTSPEGRRFSYWIKESGYPYFYAGENLAIDFYNSEELFEAWIKSDRHRENIEREGFQEIGVASLGGVFENRKTNVVVQLFGTRVLGESEISGYDRNYQPVAENPITNDQKFIDIRGLTYKSLIFLKQYVDATIVTVACLLLLTFLINKRTGRAGSTLSQTSKQVNVKSATEKSRLPKPSGTKQKLPKSGARDISIKI